MVIGSINRLLCVNNSRQISDNHNYHHYHNVAPPSIRLHQAFFIPHVHSAPKSDARQCHGIPSSSSSAAKTAGSQIHRSHSHSHLFYPGVILQSPLRALDRFSCVWWYCRKCEVVFAAKGRLLGSSVFVPLLLLLSFFSPLKFRKKYIFLSWLSRRCICR